MIPARIALLGACLLMAQVPDSGTRHDRRPAYLELGLSVNTGFPDLIRPQVELMAKHRGVPVFLSGRLGLGGGDWLGHAAIVVHPQLGVHWTRDGDASWALRLGWVMGEWLQADLVYDSLEKHASPAQSTLLGNSLALERTAFFGPRSNLAWRVALGAASAWHQYEFKGSPVGENSSSIMPFVECGLLWTSF